MKVIAHKDLKEVRENQSASDPKDELIEQLALQVSALNIEVQKLKDGVKDV